MPSEVFQIRRRRRRDPFAIVSPGDFAMAGPRRADPAMALADPRFSLYCLDERTGRALFVETPPDVDLRASPFFYQAQFEHATRLLAVPYRDLDAALDAMAGPSAQLILVYSVGRCGSTLVSRMLSRIEGCVSISEPDVFTQLVRLGLPSRTLRHRLMLVTRCLTSSPPFREAGHAALKFRSMAIEHAGVMQELFPDARMLFLYRDAVEAIRSGMRVYRYPGSLLGLLDGLRGVPLGPSVAAAALAVRRAELDRLFPAAARLSTSEIASNGAEGMLAVGWVSAMQRYLDLRAALRPIAALRYEDLVTRPASTLALAFEHCGLPPDQVAGAMGALDRDAQAGSLLAIEHQRDYRPRPDAHAAIDAVFRRCLPSGGPDLVAPGTLAQA